MTVSLAVDFAQDVGHSYGQRDVFPIGHRSGEVLNAVRVRNVAADGDGHLRIPNDRKR